MLRTKIVTVIKEVYLKTTTIIKKGIAKPTVKTFEQATKFAYKEFFL